jgi:hypothetical protein
MPAQQSSPPERGKKAEKPWRWTGSPAGLVKTAAPDRRWGPAKSGPKSYLGSAMTTSETMGKRLVPTHPHTNSCRPVFRSALSMELNAVHSGDPTPCDSGHNLSHNTGHFGLLDEPDFRIPATFSHQSVIQVSCRWVPSWGWIFETQERDAKQQGIFFGSNSTERESVLAHNRD